MELRRECKDNNAVKLIAFFYVTVITQLISCKLCKILKIYLDISEYCGIIIFTNDAALKEMPMSKSKKTDPKERALRECGALNTHPVADALFRGSDFFDSRDLVQVKYEMLRKVHKEAEPVSSAAASFGFSRPSFYKSVTAFERDGLMGLLPRKRGPRSGHKLTAEVLEFASERLSGEEPMGIPKLLDEVEKQFGIRVHRRSLERAIRRAGKKTLQIPEKKQKQVP